MRTPRLSGTEWRLALLLAAVAGTQAWLVHDMRFLASSLFGGDHAYQLACIRAIAASLDPMASCNVSGALPGYFPLYGTIVAYFARVAMMDPLPAMFVTAVLFRTLSAFVVYAVVRRRFDRPTGLVIAGLWSALHPELIFKYTEFTTAIPLPLYFLVLVRYLDRPSAARAAWLGLALAVLGYAHSVAFTGGLAIAGLSILAAAAGRVRANGPRAEAARLARHAPVIGAIALLALGYWYRPIFVYHGHTSPHYLEWNSADLSTLARRLAWAGRALGEEFSFAGPPHAALTLLLAAALGVLAARRDRARFAPEAIAGIASFVWIFHDFLTVPLLHTHFVPLYVQWMLWGTGRVFLAAIPVAVLFASRFGVKRRAWIESAALVLALVVVGAQAREWRARPDLSAAREAQDPGLAALTRWSAEHLDPGTVVLSTNELSFAWGALTGRKTLVSRRAHNDAFLDMDARNRDAALMLYGHDDTLRTRLLERYGIQYVFWARDWFASEYQVTANGDTVGYDPFLFFRNLADDETLTRAGVQYVHDYTWVDPALRGDEYARFDLTIVSPRNYASPFRPWRDDLDRRLEPAWIYPDARQPRLALFRVRPEPGKAP